MPKSDRPAAFTLVEMLVVVGIIAVLVAALLPTLGRVRDQARRVRCASNLRQTGAALFNYATRNNGRLPVFHGASNWLWDLPHATRDAIVASGATRDVLYCPASTNYEDFVDYYWNYNPSFAVMGYFWLTRRVGGTTPPLIDGRYVERVGEARAAERETVTDAIISEGGSFVQIAGNEGGETNHLRDGRPLGGNILFLDGHVAWRDFSEVRLRAVYGPVDFWY